MAGSCCGSSLTPCFCQEVQKCDLPSIYITQNSGCRSICAVTVWQPRCCHGYYGRDCLGEATFTCVWEPLWAGSAERSPSSQRVPVASALPAVTMGNVMTVTLVTAPAPVTRVLGAWPASCAVRDSTEQPVQVSGGGGGVVVPDADPSLPQPVTAQNTGHVTADAAVQVPVSATPAGWAHAAKVNKVSGRGPELLPRPPKAGSALLTRLLLSDQLPQCSPACSPHAVCQDNNTCVCRPFYQGDGLTCTGKQGGQGAEPDQR